MTPAVPRVPRFVVIGGGEAGTFYVRQLLRAAGAGRLQFGEALVLDRDAACAATAVRDPRVRVVAQDWSAWLSGNVTDADPCDHLVPYHWAPHLLVEWLQGELRRHGAQVRRGGAVAPRGLPMERDTAAGDRALSYADWMCPPTCIEPALCPHTRGARDWSLAADLEQGGESSDVPLVFRCLHLAWGVGTIPMGSIQEAGRRVVAGLGQGARSYLVATSSHCHALATRLWVAPGAKEERA